MSSNPTVSLVVVNWNGRPHLEECLPSLAALEYPRDRLEYIVVDNASGDDSVQWLTKEWPAVRVLRAEVNLGFAAAANRGAATARGELVAFLNNDLRAEPTWLGRMVEAMTTTGAAAAGSCVLDWDGRRVDFGGAGMNFAGHGVSRRHGRPYVPVQSAPVPALFACGAAMVVDRARFLASGGFDPDYFAYFEDVDLGWRLWVEGERVVYVPRACAFHRHHGSGMPDAERTRLLERNALASVVKNYDQANLAVMLPAALALLEARARLGGDEEGAVYRGVSEEFRRRRPELDAKRAAVQARRRRPDCDILPLFLEPLRPSFLGSVYWNEQRRVVREFGVVDVFERDAPSLLASGMDEFIDDLENRIEVLDRTVSERGQAIASARAEHAEESARLRAEIERLRTAKPEGSSGSERLLGILRGRKRS